MRRFGLTLTTGEVRSSDGPKMGLGTSEPLPGGPRAQGGGRAASVPGRVSEFRTVNGAGLPGEALAVVDAYSGEVRGVTVVVF